MTNYLPLADTDSDVKEFNKIDFKHMHSAPPQALSEIFGTQMTPRKLHRNKIGRPRLDNPKVPIGIRLDADVLEGFRATGKGWQTRVNGVLKEWLETHASQ